MASIAMTYTAIIRPSIIQPRYGQDTATRTVSENDILFIYCFLINWKSYVKDEYHYSAVAEEVIT